MANVGMQRLLVAVSVLGCASSRADAPTERSLGVHDVGVFADLDERVQLALPRALDPERVRAVVDRARSQLVIYDLDWPLKVYPLGGPVELRVGAVTLSLRAGDARELQPLLRPAQLVTFDERVERPPGDLDDDGVPDPLDVLLGAKKAALNADRYDGRYVHIGYPLGDVPREIGVCTDVIVRSFRNAGYDLQQLVHEDVERTRARYPMINRPNADIDHRRVKSLLPYFQRNMLARSVALADPLDPLRAGDVIFMDTFPTRPGTEHVGVLAETLNANGQPLVINNWDTGTVTKPMDLLAFVPVTHRFRLPARLPDRGPIAALRTQLLSVVSERWDAARATLRRYERAPGRGFRAVGKPVRVMLGRAGSGWGDGQHPPAGHTGPIKREGDDRSPAGVFELGPWNESYLLEASDLREVRAWLKPNAAVLVALPSEEYARMQRSWGLP